MRLASSLGAALLGIVCTSAGVVGLPGPARAQSAPAVAAQQPPPATSSSEPAPPGRGRSGAGRPGPAGGRAQQLPDPDVLGPNQVDQLFDTYMIFKAQEFLSLTDNQWLLFGQRVKTLQTLRRRVQKQRHDILAELRQLLQSPGALDEAAVTEKLRGFDDVSVQAAPEIRQAYTDIDKLLNPRQRVRFRLFEEQMEIKKMDMVAQARQRQQGRGNQPPPDVVKPPQGAVKK